MTRLSSGVFIECRQTEQSSPYPVPWKGRGDKSRYAHASLFIEKFQHRVTNIVHVLQWQFAVHWQRENLIHDCFGVRQLWQVGIEFRYGRLLVIRNGIMNASADSFALQVLRQLIAVPRLRDSDDVHVIDSVRPFFLGRSLHNATETLGVASSNASSMLV